MILPNLKQNGHRSATSRENNITQLEDFTILEFSQIQT